MNKLKHLAIIMDGNARWASSNGLPVSSGHRKGAKALRRLLPTIINSRIDYLTLYTFSSENWSRPKEEVSSLLKLVSKSLEEETENLLNQGVRVKIIGRLDRLDVKTRALIENTVFLTRNNRKLTICVAFSYAGKEEIVDACNKIMQSQKIADVDSFRNYLYDPEMPDVDLLIRTGKTYRISNFLLWQIAYAELYFLDKYWPDFNENDLEKILIDYATRQRNFGSR